MAKILDSTSVTGQMQKIVETNDGYIINGTYYDKVQMVPYPLQLFPTYGNYNDISMNNKLILNHTMNNNSKSIGDNIILDNDNTNITYVWVISTRTNDLFMLKILNDNGKLSTLQTSITIRPTTSPLPRQYCGQDDNYLYYLISCAGTYHEYFIKIDKTSLNYTVITDFSTYSWSNQFIETNDYIYMGYIQRYGKHLMQRFNKSTSIIDNITINPNTGNKDFTTCYSNNLKIDDNNFYTFSVHQNISLNNFGITKYKFDLTQSVLTNIVNESECNITWGSGITGLPNLATNLNIHYEPFINKVDDKYYLNVFVYELQISSTAANLPSYGIYTFLIDNTTFDLTFKSYVQPTTNDYIRGFLSTHDNNFLIPCSSNTTFFMSFNTETEQFDNLQQMNNIPYSVGIDQSENIWIENSLTEVDYITPFTPTNIVIDSELDSYKYNGVDINTYCTIVATNYNNENISCNLQLTIKGNAIFKDNSSKTINITSQSTGPLQVNMIIKGAGNVSIYPQLLM